MSEGTLQDYTALAEKILTAYPKRQSGVSAAISRLSFDEGGAIILPAIGTESAVLTFTVPNGYDGIANMYSINFLGGGFTQGSGDIVWRILRNGLPIRNFENITTERGSQSTPKPLNDVPLYSNDVISITVMHVANAALIGQVVVSMAGYYTAQ